METTEFAAKAPSIKRPGLASLSIATEEDRRSIYKLRYTIYSQELGQHSQNGSGSLSDKLDAVNEYIVAMQNNTVVGFVSITPPTALGYSIDKYVDRAMLDVPFDSGLFEIRLLTVRPESRTASLASALMYAAYRYVASKGGSHVVCLGRVNATIKLYERLGFVAQTKSIASGMTRYVVMSASVDSIREAIEGLRPVFSRIQGSCKWKLPLPMLDPTACFHGGASIRAIGDEYRDPERRAHVITADVLDAWFPPSPNVLSSLRDELPYLLQASPPADGRGLRRAIARARNVPYESIALGAGSSDFIFRALMQRLDSESRVLLLDPTYGEYAFVAGEVIGCKVDRFELSWENNFRIDPARLRRTLQRHYDLVIIVNPNSPTGQHLSRTDLLDLISDSAPDTGFWVDETYIDYVGATESLEPDVARFTNLVVCKSMSKAYALSGARVAYMVGPAEAMADLRSGTPPWVIGFPSQVSGIRALEDPEYYTARYEETRVLRADLTRQVRMLPGVVNVLEGVANFILVRTGSDGPTAEMLCRRCRDSGLYVRSLRQMTPRAEPDTIRIAVKDAATNARMVSILAAVFEEFLVPAQAEF